MEDVLVAFGVRHGIVRHDDDHVAVVQLDVGGRVRSLEPFPTHLLLHALIRAEELFGQDEAEGESLAGSRRRLRVWRGWDAYTSERWDEVDSFIAPDCVLVDHRSTSWPDTRGKAAVLKVLHSAERLAEERQRVVRAVNLLTDDAIVMDILSTGTTAGGGTFEQAYVVFLAFSDAGVHRIEPFPEGSVDAALRAAGAIGGGD